MNFVTSVFKKYINKDEAKTQKISNTFNDAPGPSTAETSKISEVKETNNVTPVPENFSETKGSAPLSEEEDCFQDAQTMPSNITNNQNNVLISEAPSNKGLNITKKVEYLFENKNMKDIFDNSMVKILEPQETPVETSINTMEALHHDDCQSFQKNDKADEAALDNAEVNQATKFVSLNEILFDSSYKFATELSRQDLKPQNEANMDTARSALEVLIQNVNEAFVCTTDTAEKNNEENCKVQPELLMPQQNYLDEQNSKACKEEEVETQKRKCDAVEEIVKKLKTDKYSESVRDQENIENQNEPEKIVNPFVLLKPGETQDMDIICKVQVEENNENIKYNEITNNFKFIESNNNTKDNKIVELSPECANPFLEENKMKSKTEIEINSSVQVTKTTKGQGEDKNDNDNQYLKQVADQNLMVHVIKEEETQKNNEGDLVNPPLLQEDSLEKLMQEKNKGLVKIENQQGQANPESLVPQKDLSPTMKLELVNSLTNSDNKTSEDKTSLKQEHNKGDPYYLVKAPMVQEDSPEQVMLEPNRNLEIQDQHAKANLESLVTQTEDLSSAKKFVNPLTNSESENKTSDIESVKALITQEDSTEKVMLEQNKNLEIQDHHTQANLESLVTQTKDLSSIKELVNPSTNSECEYKTSDVVSLLKQVGNRGDTFDLVNAPMTQEDTSEKCMLEQNKNLEIQYQNAQANVECLVKQTEDTSLIKELVNPSTNLETENKTNDIVLLLKQVGNKGDMYDLVTAPMIQEDTSKNVMLEQNKNLEIQDHQANADLEILVTQIEDLSSTNELVQFLTNSESENKTSDNESLLEQVGNKGGINDLVKAPMIQEDSSETVMLEQNKNSAEIQHQQAQAKLERLVTQNKDLPPTKELFNSATNSDSINATSVNEPSLKIEGNKGDLNDLVNAHMIQEKIKENKHQDTYEDFASSPIKIQDDSSVKVVQEKISLVEVKDLNYQDITELNSIKNQDTQNQKTFNTKTHVSTKLPRESKQSQANFKLSATENINENLVEKTTQNYLEKHTKEDEQVISVNKTYDRQDTKEFEKLERECKMNFKSDTTINEESLTNKPTNFGRQDTQGFKNLGKKLETQSITDDFLDELVAESKTDNKVCLKFFKKDDDQCEISPIKASETQISSGEKIEETDSKIVAENRKTFFRQDTLEFEKLEKQCTEVTCLDVLDELVAKSTRDSSIGNEELIESIKCELVSTPCKETNENVFKQAIEENKSGLEGTVVEAQHKNNKTTFLEIHLQSKNAAKHRGGKPKSNAEEKDDNVKNKLQIQVRSVNKNKQQNQLSEVACQKQEKHRTVNEELKSKVDDLQLELDTIRKMNRRKGKCVATSKVETDENGNVVSKYKNVINEYEKHIVQQNSDLEKLKIENERNMRHFTNTEMAFSDVFEKYEKAKYVIAAYAKNEDILLENLQNAEEQLTKIETKCVAMKENSFEQIKQAKQHVEQEKQKYNQEIAKLQGQVKRLEIKASSLEVALNQKTDECQALASLCDDITGRNST